MSGGNCGASSSSKVMPTSSGVEYAAMRDHEFSVVVARYVAAWADDETPPTNSKENVPLPKTTDLKTKCNLIPLARFLKMHNADFFPRVCSLHSASEQPSKKHPAFVKPPATRCDHCNVDATSQEHLRKHMLGARHARRMQLVALDIAIVHEFGLGGLLEKLDFAKWRCIPCNAKMSASAVSSHMVGARHLSKIRLRLRVGEKVDRGVSTPRSPRKRKLTQKGTPGTSRPLTTSNSSGDHCNPHATLNDSTEDFYPSGTGASSWRASSSVKPPPASMAAAAQESAGSDAGDWCTYQNPVPTRARSRSKKGMTRKFACSTSSVVCNSHKTLKGHLGSEKHERTVYAVRKHAGRSPTASVDISKGGWEPTGKASPPVGERSPPPVTSSVVLAGGDNMLMEENKPAHALVANAPSLERTSTSSILEQPFTRSILPALSLCRLGSFEIVPDSKSNNRVFAKPDNVMTNSSTYPLAFMPEGMAFANHGLRRQGNTVVAGSSRMEKEGARAMEKMRKNGSAIDKPRSVVFSALSRAADEGADRGEENTTGPAVLQSAVRHSTAALNVTHTEDDAHGRSSKNVEMGRMMTACAALSDATRTSNRTSEKAGATEKDVEKGQVNEAGVPTFEKMLKFGRVAMIPTDDVTGICPLNDEAMIENSLKQEEKALVVDSPTKWGSNKASANAEASASDAPKSGVLPFTAHSVLSRTKHKKTKDGRDTSSPTPEKDFLLWCCNICREKSNADMFFEKHLENAMHIKLQEVPMLGCAGGTDTGRVQSLSVSGGKNLNSLPSNNTTLFCGLCNVQCRSETTQQEHLSSLNHKSKLSANLSEVQNAAQFSALAPAFGSAYSHVGPSSIVPSSPGPSSVVSSSPNDYYPLVITCAVCNVSFSGFENYMAHVDGIYHAKRVLCIDQ